MFFKVFSNNLRLSYNEGAIIIQRNYGHTAFPITNHIYDFLTQRCFQDI